MKTVADLFYKKEDFEAFQKRLEDVLEPFKGQPIKPYLIAHMEHVVSIEIESVIRRMLVKERFRGVAIPDKGKVGIQFELEKS